MTTDEALAHAAKELPEGCIVEIQAIPDFGIELELIMGGLFSMFRHDESAPLAANILRAVAWAKEQVK